MATIPGLGVFSKFPREIRDMIYKHFIHVMHWPAYQDERWPIKHRSERCCLTEAQTVNSLAIMRTSGVLYSELSEMLYDGWGLVFTSHPERYNVSSASTWAFYPTIEVRVVHPRHGTAYLFVLDSYWKARMYCDMPYHRWSYVKIEMLPPKKTEPGGIYIAWRASKTLAWVLESRRPARLTIEICDKWYGRGNMVFATGSGSRMMSIGVSMTLPFSHLTNARHEKAQSQKTQPRCTEPIDWADHSIKTTHVEVLPPRRKSCETQIAHPLQERSVHRWFAELWFDAALDDTPEELAGRLRLKRWHDLNSIYVSRFIKMTRTLSEPDRSRNFKLLAERWAVHQSMNDHYRRADFGDWLGRDRKEKPLGRSVKDFRPDEETLMNCFTAEEWRNPRKGDSKWRRLKWRGLFYFRRILITSEEVVWDPNHIVSNQNVPYKPAFNDVLYVHEPPKRPRREPKEGLDDPRFHFVPDTPEYDSDYP